MLVADRGEKGRLGLGAAPPRARVLRMRRAVALLALLGLACVQMDMGMTATPRPDRTLPMGRAQPRDSTRRAAAGRAASTNS